MDISDDVRAKYTAVIGLEVHVQLLTESKIFSSDETFFGASPNTQVSVVSLAHPGTLPRLNRKALEFAVKMGLACQSEINRLNLFDRKNYFYPDLPKGYQLTQDRTPICRGGFVPVMLKTGETKNIILNRIHLEEDAGKSIHVDGEEDTLVDFNRAGMPLIEIVTEPVIRTSEEAYVFLSEIRKMVKYLDICDGNMEEGSLRCDVNVSIMLNNSETFGKKVEIKNMNSVRNVQRAIEVEIDRQIAWIESGEDIVSETRTFDADAGVTSAMRTKEELNDYRYFPDPDLSPVVVTDTWLDEIKSGMPELPQEVLQKLVNKYQLSEYDARLLSDSKEIADYFLSVVRHTNNYKAASNWIMGPVKSYLNEHNLSLDQFPVRAETLAELIGLIDEGKLSFSVASQQVFSALISEPENSVLNVAQQLNVMQDSDESSILSMIEEVMATFPEKVAEYRKGKKGLKAMFIGEVMKRSKGKADPRLTDQLITKKLQQV